MPPKQTAPAAAPKPAAAPAAAPKPAAAPAAAAPKPAAAAAPAKAAAGAGESKEASIPAAAARTFPGAALWARLGAAEGAAADKKAAAQETLKGGLLLSFVEVLAAELAAEDLPHPESFHVIAALATADEAVAAAAEPHLAMMLQKVMELTVPPKKKKKDSDSGVAKAAEAATVAIGKGISPFAAPTVLPTILACLGTEAKVQTRLAALQLMIDLASRAPRELTTGLPLACPVLTANMWDTNTKVKAAAKQAMEACCDALENKDIKPFVPALISAIAAPEEVSECIFRLSGTTFVQTVDPPVLSLTVPILVRGFGERNTAVKRMCAKLVDNLSKLVEDADGAAPFLPELMPLLERLKVEISDPECRQQCEKAYLQLGTIKAAIGTSKVVYAKTELLLPMLQAHATAMGAAAKPATAITLGYAAEMSVNALNPPVKSDAASVVKAVRAVLGIFNAPAAKLEEAMTKYAAEIKPFVKVEEEEPEEEDAAEMLCDCAFSLAYGSKILLNDTRLKLKRGHRYGLVGGNGCGKTTLLRAIANYQVDGFPPATELRTVFVETDIQGAQADMDVTEFTLDDERLKSLNITTERVKEVLGSVGFSKAMMDGKVRAEL